MRKTGFLATVLCAFLYAADGHAQPFNVTISPNNFNVAAGSSATTTVTTQSNSATPAAANAITYTVSLTPDFAGGTPQIPNNTPQISTKSGSTWSPVTIVVNVPASAVPGVYSGQLFGTYNVTPSTTTTTALGAVFINVTPSSPSQQDFVVAATPPALTLSRGGSQPILFSATGTNGFAGPITVSAPSVPNLTFTPPQLTLTPGQSGVIVAAAGTAATSQTLTAAFTASASANGSTITHAVPVIITIASATNVPAITSITPPGIVRGAPPATLRVAGANFEPGAVVFADSPSIVVQSTRVLSGNFADVTLAAQADADVHGTYTLRLRNPDGGVTPEGAQIFLYDQDAIGAPLAVRSAIIVSPVQGTLIAGTDTVYPRGLVATSGSGILHGQWRLDGNAYEAFDVVAHAGMPVEVLGRLKVPIGSWGDHILTLAVATRIEDLAPGSQTLTVSPDIAVTFTIETATKFTIFAPPDRVIIGRDAPLFRWSLVPGATSYLLEAGTRQDPALRTFRVLKTSWTPTREELRDLRSINGGVVVWRVRPLFPGDVRGEPAAARAMVLLPEVVALHLRTSPGGQISWKGGAAGLLYQIDVLNAAGSLLVHAIAVRPQYSIPRFVRTSAAMVRVTACAPAGDCFGGAATVRLTALTLQSTAAASPGSIAATPAEGSTVATTQPVIEATWPAAVQTGDITLLVDATDMTPLCVITPTSVHYDSVIPLTAGPHSATVHAGSAQLTWNFTVSTTAAAPVGPAAPAAPPVPHDDYTLAPNGTISWAHPGTASESAQLSAQGDVENASYVGTKFTGDLAYKATSHPRTIAQQSRNWVINGTAGQTPVNGQATFGYTTPNFTAGAEFLTSGVARLGAAGEAATTWGNLDYYQQLTTTVTGAVSGTNQNLHIHSFAYSTPERTRYQFRAIALEVSDPGQTAVAGSRMRTFGAFGTYNFTPQVSLVGEIAHGNLRPDCSSLSPSAIAAGAVCPTQSRSGNALRLGFSGTTTNATTYGLMLRHVDANFINPANRALTAGGIADRTSADLNLGRTFGKTTLSLTAQEQLGGRSHNSSSPRSSDTAATISATTVFNPHLNLTATGSASLDRASASAAFSLPRTDRVQGGVNATMSELLGQGYTVSETLGIQRADDRINALTNQTTSSANVTFSGTVRPNLTLSANGGVTHSAGSSTMGTTNQYLLSVQPSIAFPGLFLSLAPRVGYNRSTNDLTRQSGSGAQYAAVLQWSPTWWSSLLSGQASANWNGNASSAPLSRTHAFSRNYQASINIRWDGLHQGAAVTAPSVLPGAAPAPPALAQQGAPAVAH